MARYEQMVDVARHRAPAAAVCGLHVHVAMPDRTPLLRAFEGVVPWLPVLLALSANSPSRRGEDTGLRVGAGRAAASLLPTGGTPPVLRELGRLASGHRRATRRAPSLGRLAAARVRDARGAGDGHADRRAADRPGSPRSCARSSGRSPGRTAGDAVRPRALRAPPGGGALGRPPDPAEVEALGRTASRPSSPARRSSSRGSCSTGRPEAERQLEVAAADGIAAVAQDVVERTLG